MIKKLFKKLRLKKAIKLIKIVLRISNKNDCLRIIRYLKRINYIVSLVEDSHRKKEKSKECDAVNVVHLTECEFLCKVWTNIEDSDIIEKEVVEISKYFVVNILGYENIETENENFHKIIIETYNKIKRGDIDYVENS